MPSPPRHKRYSHRQHVIETSIGLALLGGRAAALSYRLGLHGKLGVTRHTVALQPKRRLLRPDPATRQCRPGTGDLHGAVVNIG